MRRVPRSLRPLAGGWHPLLSELEGLKKLGMECYETEPGSIFVIQELHTQNEEGGGLEKGLC